MRPRKPLTVSQSTTSTSYVTILDIKGIGRLAWILGYVNDTSAYTMYLKITIDGYTSENSFSASVNSPQFVYGVVNSQLGVSTSTPTAFDLHFKSDLKIEIKSSNSSKSAVINMVYELE